ncbi:MAG: amidohydrolase family protein [Steroidobacteraceae bacterium]
MTRIALALLTWLMASGPLLAGGTGTALPLAASRYIDIDTDEGTWLSPDLSPDGKTIVFELLGDLYRLEATGGDARALTSGMAFDSQPVFSPDGSRIAFISDRSGAENLWVMRADGSAPQPISNQDDNSVFTSPGWSADGRSLFASRYVAAGNYFELWRFDVTSGAGERLIPAASSGGQIPQTSVLGAVASGDGRYLVFAQHDGENDFDKLPEWRIVRRDLATGADEVLIAAPRSPRPDLVIGTAFRPALSHDGRLLVYGARDRGRTGLRVLDLGTRSDRWLAYPVQQDELQASGWRDLLPNHVFTPDDRELLANVGGKLQRIDIATGAMRMVPFRVKTRLPIAASTRATVREETGPVRARLIQDAMQSPDGRRLAFSALGQIYVQTLDGRSSPQRLTPGFQPSWSSDGNRLTYVTWNAREAGQVWVIDMAGGAPQRLSNLAAYYTSPTFAPDDSAVFVLRSSHSVRMHSYMEYGAFRQADLVRIDLHTAATAGDGKVVVTGQLGGKPHFGPGGRALYLRYPDGVHEIDPGDGSHRLRVNVTGPGWYFVAGRANADDMRISPDGNWVLAHIAQQLHLLRVPVSAATIDIGDPAIEHHQLTKVGADFFGWSTDGKSITWSLGNRFHRRAIGATGADSDQVFEANVDLPRDRAQGRLLLRGATVITERGDEIIPDADLLIENDRIAAIGQRGTVRIPPQTTTLELTGQWIIPGLIDAHDHIADIRRGILDFESWGPRANLAYGVTTAFDPSPLSIDMLAYQDAVDAGLMAGSRIASTGPALFSFNEFRSYEQVHDVLSRYRDAYRLGNIKMYRSGNRHVRQWIAMAARDLGLHPTTEGALSMKLDMTQIIDGYAGNEHALTAVPLYRDMIDLVAKSGVAWTATLQITNGGPEGQDYFIVRDKPANDAKLNRFAPRFVVDIKTRSRTYRELAEYLFPRVAASTAAVQRAGGIIGMGSHGEMPGLGMHWEMQAHVMGGMTPAEALRAATLGSAKAIGREAEFGSLEPGKFADLVILERSPLTDIGNTLAISAVMRGGRLYDGGTLAEKWPRQRPLGRAWYCDDRPPTAADACQ